MPTFFLKQTIVIMACCKRIDNICIVSVIVQNIIHVQLTDSYEYQYLFILKWTFYMKVKVESKDIHKTSWKENEKKPLYYIYNTLTILVYSM